MDHNGDPTRVAPVTCDMSPGFAKGMREHPPNAAEVIDKFHVVKHANGAVDKVRKTQAGRNPLLRRTEYPWLRNEEGLTGLQLETGHNLRKQRVRTGRARRMRGTLQDIHATGTSRMQAEAGFRTWCSWMMHSRPEPMKTLARRIRRHWRDILTYFDHRCTNAIPEGLNGIIQHIKTRARGLRNMDYFSTMIHPTRGKLDLATVTI
jgi:transposase